MQLKILATVLAFYTTALLAIPPKTDVVIETVDGILLHAEYVSENEKNHVVDIRAAIFPPALCEAKDWPKYLPKGRFTKSEKLNNGSCRFVGSPFVARSVALTGEDIKRRFDTTLLTLSAKGEKKQLPFFDDTSAAARGFDFSANEEPAKGETPLLGVRAFSKDSATDTLQTVDSAGKRETLYPSRNLFHKWSSLDPRIGLYYTPLLPTGAINILNFGVIGFTVENSIAIPDMKFLPLKKYHLRLRGGINVGYNSFSQDLYQNGQAVSTGKITLLPVLAQLTLFWDLRPGSWKMTISPFVRLGDGIILSTVQTQVKPEFMPLLAPGAESSRSGSYIGNGFSSSIGFEIRPDKWPVAFSFDGGYLMHAQDIVGSYFMFNAGAAWHYGVNPPEPKMLPIQYLGAKSVVLNLKGTVKNPDGTAINAATLKLTAKGSAVTVKEAPTNDKGQYAMELEPGLDYIVEAHKDGYAKAIVELPLVSNDKRTRDQDFILAPLTYSLEGVNFKPDSDQLVTGKAPEKALTELVAFLKKNPEIKIEIGGHTAARGDDDPATIRLSEKRAETVRKYLIAKGIEEGRLTATGYGGSKPIADGKTDAGAKKNRRVEVRILVD
ncbi:MAG: OmpA family protein [Spirochaetes bacterium]|nr:OmpA family protein [Spirochaetota bacterium]